MSTLVAQTTAHSLPSLARSRSGTSFDPTADHWIVRDPVSVLDANFHNIAVVGPDLVFAAKATLMWMLERHASSHAQNLFRRLEHFVRAQGQRISEVQEINEVIFLDYRASLPSSRKWYVSHLSGFLRAWIDLGYKGVAADLVKCLDNIVLPGNAKGHHVRSHDRDHGPLNEFEFQFCWSILDNAHAAGELSDAQHLILTLEMALAPRPIQLAAMRTCDVREDRAASGELLYFVDVPRAKNSKMPRAEFKRRQLNPQLGSALVKYANSVRALFAEVLEDPAMAPLFPAEVADSRARAEWQYHRTNQRMSEAIRIGWKSVLVDVNSLRINARRLRYTLGTRAAQEGHGVFVIAEMLDHSTTQSTHVYVESTPAITDRITRAMASQLGALAQVFRGHLINGEQDATRRDDPSSRIEDYRIDAPTPAMGSCAKSGPCSLLAPMACYTCPSFEPWVDGPHEAVLQHMLGERDRLMDAKELRLAAILDLQIAAAAAVCDLCAQRLRGSSDA